VFPLPFFNRILPVAVLAVGLAPAADARDVTFGPRVSLADDADFGVGADIRWTFLGDDPRLAVVASFDYFFPEEPGGEIDDVLEDIDERFGHLLPFPIDLDELVDIEEEYFEANLNLTWDFTGPRAVVPYAGLGAFYGRRETSFFGFDRDEDDFGANVLAGIRIKDRFYVEAKQEAGGAEMFVLSAGVRF
jgi:hypothetical protein